MIEIRIFQGNDLTLPYADANIVIDVVRAFTVSHYAFLQGAERILLVPEVAAALTARDELPNALLAGEVGGVMIEGFDLDNSPRRFAEIDLRGRTIIQKTTNGVKAALHSLGAPTVLVTGFSNARATAIYLARLTNLKSVNLVASHPTGDEDLACAEYIRSLILGEEIEPEEVQRRIRGSATVQKFLDPAQPAFDPADIGYCCEPLSAEFVMAVTCEPKPTVRKVML